MTGEAAAFSWGRVWRAAYLPIMLTGAAVGAATPVAALRASELGADLRTAALIVALVGVGQLLDLGRAHDEGRRPREQDARRLDVRGRELGLVDHAGDFLNRAKKVSIGFSAL